MGRLPTRISGNEEDPDMRSMLRGSMLFAILLVANPILADAEPESEPEQDAEVEQVWSATVIGEFKKTSDAEAHDDVGAFFDQYEFAPNKGTSVPIELGIRDFSYDRFVGPGETPQVQFRFASPTSNLGISGSDIDHPFLNQRAVLFGRRSGVELDLKYWRLRTEDLRVFPNTLGRQFDDMTKPGDRFDRERTGMFGEVRLRPEEMRSDATSGERWLAPEIALRGGFEERDGQRQLLFMQDQSNAWGALTQDMDQSSAQAGGGLLVAPGGLFTMAFDVDYDRFRQKSSTIIDSDLGPPFLPGDDTVGFIPDTERLTGSVQVNSRIGERAVLTGGFQVSRLEQVGDSTPNQSAAGLDDNHLLFYSLNAAADVDLTEAIAVNAFFKYDQRKNKIQRNTALFNPIDNNVQFDPFLKRWDRIYTGAEATYAFQRRNQVAVGGRYEWIDRDLEFGLPTNRVILEPNARVADQTKMWTVYGRTNLRPMKGLGISGEVGYRGAPDTGYVLDLDDYVYGKFNASYAIPIELPIVLSTFVRGGSGENRDFSAVSGVGPNPAGSETRIKFERREIAWGLTVSSYPTDDVSVFASFFQAYNDQNYHLVLSDLQRYWQSSAGVNFSNSGSPDDRNRQTSFVLGTHVDISENTDAGLSFSFTRAELHYNRSGQPANVKSIEDNSSIDSDIYGVQLEVGHWIRDGLRLLVGYRLQLYDDSSPQPSGTGSVVSPNGPSMSQHTLTLGITLTSDLLAKSD
jgi:hypothetical protein